MKNQFLENKIGELVRASMSLPNKETMKIEFWNESNKQYLEILPSVTFGWKPFRFTVGWLFWFLHIEN